MKALALSLVVALVVSSCAAGPPKLLGQPVEKPIAVLLRVSTEAARSNDLGGTAALVEAITEGLSERGVKNDVFAADDDQPPAPRIEIWVEKWEVGNRSERAVASVFFGGLGEAATSGEYSVICRVYRDGDTKPAYVERFKGGILGSSETASTSKGETIAGSLLRAAFGERPRFRAGPGAAR